MGRRAERTRGVYGISVAAELTGLGVQTLRWYETRGLLQPQRTPGGTRRYSHDDIDRLNRISDLIADGLNVVGVRMVLDLQDTNTRLRQERKTPMAKQPDHAAEADLLDQATPVVETEDDTQDTTPPAPHEADPADVWEQHLPVPHEDDENPSEDTH